MIDFKKKSVKITMVCCVLAVCAAAATGGWFLLNPQAAKANGKGSKQSDYPTLPMPAQFEERYVGVDRLVQDSTLIVDATVEKVLPEETRKDTPESGSFEAKVDAKLGKSGSEYRVRPVMLNIRETLKGKASSDQITMYIPPMALDCSPNFKKGDRLIFMLSEYPGGGYAALTTQQAYFHVSSDSKIYPAVVNDKLKGESGKSLRDFENEIKKLAGN